MSLLRRYLTSEIASATLFVFAALVSLFFFLDFVRELKDLGQGEYRLPQVLSYVALTIPGRIYELAPIAALIGTLFALAQLVANSEYTVMRVSGMSMSRLAGLIAQVGLGLALVTFLLGEFVVPAAEQTAQRLRVRAKSGLVVSDFRSGIWVKERDSFVNVARPLPDGRLEIVQIYQFDDRYRLRTISRAARGYYQEDQTWRLEDVVQTVFEDNATEVRRLPEMQWVSVLSPEILTVLLVDPEQRSARDLLFYIEHLRENRQQTARYETAFWTKFSYPLAVLIMMVLALPFAHVQRRVGGVGAKIFAGIMLGIVFHLVNRLVGYSGSILDWPPLLSAALPGALFLLTAVLLIWWLERR